MTSITAHTIAREFIEAALDNAGIDWNDLNDTYSGRGMYSGRCLSFTIAGKRVQRDLCRFFVDLGMRAATAAHDGPVAQAQGVAQRLAANVCTDDLGMDMIVYFPGWTLAQ